MDGRKYSEHRTDKDLEEFKAMRFQISDMVSNILINHEIITPEERELLRKLLHEIEDIIQDIETVPNGSSFSIVTGQTLSDRKVLTIDKFRNVMYAFDNNKSVASVLKGEGEYRRSAFLSSDSLENDDTFFHSIGNENTKFKVNYGYEDNESPAKGRATKAQNTTVNGQIINEDSEPTKNEYTSSSSVGNSVRSDQSADNSRRGNRFNDAIGYFLDDYEAESTVLVVSDDNWTFKKSVSSENNTSEACELQNDPNDYPRNTPVKTLAEGEYRNSKQWELKETIDGNGKVEKQVDSETNEIRDDDNNDYNYYDDTVVALSNDDKCNDKDINDALGGFDYLEEYQSETNSSTASLCGSGTSLESIGKEETGTTTESEKVKKSVNNKHELPIHEKITSVKDVLGAFDYLDQYHDRTNSVSTESLAGSEYNLDLDNVPIADLNGESHKSIISDYESERDVTGDVREKSRRDYINVTRRTSNNELVELSGQNRVPDSVLEPDIDYENELEHLNTSYLNNNFGIDDAEEKSVLEDKPYRHMAYKDINNVYTYDKETDTNVRNQALVGRARSEERVSGFTHGEFILRRTQSEEIHNRDGAFRQKPRLTLDVLPEDEHYSSSDTEGAEQAEKQKIDTNNFDVCGFLLKVLMLILFGIGVTEIVLGVIFRKGCDIEEIVPIFTIASGGVSIVYCIVYVAIHLVRKRTSKISRSSKMFLVFIWLTLLGVLIAGGVLLYPAIKEHAFKDCPEEPDCCRRKLILITFGAIIIDLICQICYVIGICRV